ncbi:MAG: T9SS type A sorting domain-containing protein [Candidatus Marinimicrobia bacterium]|nr:T9SS type A sorting domain-containing protein [Candidatus Neomarinimicrobiota bacterium]
MKKLTFSLLVIIVLTMSAFGTSIEKSGDIVSDETWSADTVKVTDSLTVVDSVTLTINPGTVVEFQGHHMIFVQGRLLAEGTVSDTILFTINDTTGFSDIQSTNGGWHGIRFYNTPSTNDSSFFSYCKFEYGKALVDGGDYTEKYGGAFFIRSFNKILISHCLITNNASFSYGGGLFIDGYININNCKIINNFSDGSAGGVYLSSINSFENNLIANNSSKVAGGGIYLHGLSVEILNNTIVNNNTKGSGGGLYFNWSSSASIVNTIIYNNTATNDGNQVYLSRDACDPVFSYCDIQGDSSAFSGDGAGASYQVAYENNIDDNPMFTNTTANPYQIIEISPCVNSGDTSVTVSNKDIMGNDRIKFGLIDIGAYELQNSTPPVITALPNAIEFENDTTSLIGIWALVNDNETEDSLLTYTFTSSNPSVVVAYDTSTGILTLSSDDSYTGTSQLNIEVSDNINVTKDSTVINVTLPEFVYSTTAGGHWGNTASWIGGKVPAETQNVVIQGPVQTDGYHVKSMTIADSGNIYCSYSRTFVVDSNLTNNGIVDWALFTVQIGGDLIVNGPMNGKIHFTGNNNHNLNTTTDVAFNPGILVADSSKITATSDIHINATAFPDFVATEIDLSGGYSMYLQNVRLGSSYYTGLYGFRTKIIGAGNIIYFNDNSPNDQYFYTSCEIHDVILDGNTYFGGDVSLYGEVINNDSLFTAVGTGGWVIDVQGNFSNNGVVNSDLKFNFSSDFTNDGEFLSNEVIFTDSSDHILKTLNDNWINVSGKFHSMNKNLIAGSDLYIAGTGYIEFFVSNLDLSNGYDLHTKNIRIGGAYYSGLYGFRTKITGAGNTIYFNENLPDNGYYYQYCDLHDVNLMGKGNISSGVAFYGEVINDDSLLTASGTGGWNVDVQGNFTNNGTVGGDIIFDFSQHFINNGIFDITEGNFVGTENQYCVVKQDVNSNIKFDANKGTSSYQWKKDDSDMSGETTAILSFTNMTSADYGKYICATDAGDSRFIKVQAIDYPFFKITDVVITNIDSFSTRVTWNTTKPASGFIFYAESDTSSGFPLETEEPDTNKLSHSLVLDTLTFGSTYYFIIDQNDSLFNNIRSGTYSFIAGDSINVGIVENTLPQDFLLKQNYPNPFNPQTTIEYSLPKNEFVNLQIFNLKGQLVKTLISKQQKVGNYSVVFDGSNFASGIYVYKLQAGNFVDVRKLILIK